MLKVPLLGKIISDNNTVWKWINKGKNWLKQMTLQFLRTNNAKTLFSLINQRILSFLAIYQARSQSTKVILSENCKLLLYLYLFVILHPHQCGATFPLSQALHIYCVVASLARQACSFFSLLNYSITGNNGLV